MGQNMTEGRSRQKPRNEENRRTSKDLGRAAETEALYFLQQQGYREVARNYRCRQGEIDLIVTKDDNLVFVEVRSRSRKDYGLPEETVNYAKQQKIRYTAQYFLMKNPNWENYYCRFDVISVLWNETGEKSGAQPVIQWYADAFQ